MNDVIWKRAIDMALIGRPMPLSVKPRARSAYLRVPSTKMSPIGCRRFVRNWQNLFVKFLTLIRLNGTSGEVKRLSGSIRLTLTAANGEPCTADINPGEIHCVFPWVLTFKGCMANG